MKKKTRFFRFGVRGVESKRIDSDAALRISLRLLKSSPNSARTTRESSRSTYLAVAAEGVQQARDRYLPPFSNASSAYYLCVGTSHNIF